MNKQELNNEIILCRPAVRKARVAVIRKILKKIKILKACKIEALKEKKLKKTERLFEKVQIMKKLRDDEVTKFALRSTNLDIHLKGSESDPKPNALAYLARHKAVVGKISSIREKIPHWETELPILLDSLGKKKNKSTKKEVVRAYGPKNKNEKVQDDIMIKKSQCNSRETPVKLSRSSQLGPPRNFRVNEEEENKNASEGKVSNESDRIEKIKDSFFIEKEVIAPKLFSKTMWNSEKSSAVAVGRLNATESKRENRTTRFYIEPVKPKENSNHFRVPGMPEGNLHPSWAAKKVQLIKPFQGKKIIFSDE